jgi:DNA-binding NarL/FixJ family response regulator
MAHTRPPTQSECKLNKVKVLLADDHPGFPELVEHILPSEFEVVGKVANGRSLVEETMKLTPDVIVTDITMPVLNGIEAVDQLMASGCKSRIVFLTVHSDSDFIRRCFAAGASGYVFKSHVAVDLVPAIREALAGHVFVSRSQPQRSFHAKP